MIMIFGLIALFFTLSEAQSGCMARAGLPILGCNLIDFPILGNALGSNGCAVNTPPCSYRVMCTNNNGMDIEIFSSQQDCSGPSSSLVITAGGSCSPPATTCQGEGTGMILLDQYQICCPFDAPRYKKVNGTYVQVQYVETPEKSAPVQDDFEQYILHKKNKEQEIML